MTSVNSSVDIYIGNVVIGKLANENLVKANWGVVVNTSGTILAAGPKSDILEIYSGHVTHLKPFELLMPGFIDAHLHAPQFGNLGIHTDLPLLDWLKTYTFPTEHRFRDIAYGQKIYPAVIKTTLNRGTTTAAYFASIHKESTVVLAEAAKQYGQRAFIGKVNMDSNTVAEYYQEDSVQQSIKDTEWVIQGIENLSSDLVEPIITPRFAISCTGGLLTKLGEIAKNKNLAVQTHVSENQVEIQVTKELFPDCKDYLEVYEKTGLIGKRTLLAHGIYLTEDELNRLSAAGTTVVHCPDSNTGLVSGFFNAQTTSESGVNIALGTDVSGGSFAGMLDSMRMAESVSKTIAITQNTQNFHVNYRQSFLYATLNGAKSLGIDHITGSLEVGKSFDAIIVDVAKATESVFVEDDTPEELLERFIHIGDAQSIRRVFVAGKEVVTK